MACAFRASASFDASTSFPQRDNNFQRLSNEEYKVKIEKGRCFRCDKKFVPGHRYRFRQLWIMISSEDQEEATETVEEEGEASES